MWRDGTASERLDGESRLLLTPSIDHLFDRGVPQATLTGGGVSLMPMREQRTSNR
jgi:hypothetical protein